MKTERIDIVRKSKLARRILAAMASAIVALSATDISSAQTFNLGGTIMSGDPVENGRIDLNGVASMAGTSKPFPGIYGSTSTLYFFEDYSFTNTSASAEPITITLTGSSSNPLSSAAYLTPFNPTSIATNYLGDAGSSVVQNGPSVTYGVTVPALTSFDVIVNEVNSMGGNSEYFLSVQGPGSIVAGTSPVPEGSRGILVISVVFIGFLLARRRIISQQNGAVSRTFLIVLAALMTTTFSARANLVVNPGFETGDYTGWTVTGDTSATAVGSAPHTGNFADVMGPVNSNGFLDQLIPTVPGQSYVVDFWLANDASANNSFSASFNAVSIVSLTNSASFSYTHYVSVPILATTNSTDLKFTYFNPPAFWYLDDVTVNEVTATPEPATVALIAFGAVSLAWKLRRHRSA